MHDGVKQKVKGHVCRITQVTPFTRHPLSLLKQIEEIPGWDEFLCAESFWVSFPEAGALLVFLRLSTRRRRSTSSV
jgi:hypothetical protein